MQMEFRFRSTLYLGTRLDMFSGLVGVLTGNCQQMHRLGLPKTDSQVLTTGLEPPGSLTPVPEHSNDKLHVWWFREDERSGAELQNLVYKIANWFLQTDFRLSSETHSHSYKRILSISKSTNTRKFTCTFTT